VNRITGSSKVMMHDFKPKYILEGGVVWLSFKYLVHVLVIL